MKFALRSFILLFAVAVSLSACHPHHEITQEKITHAATANMGNHQRANAPIDDEIGRQAILVRNKIQQQWRQPTGFENKKLNCKVAVKSTATGEVTDVKVIQSSGNVEFDRSVELALHKASPLPMPKNAEVAKQFQDFDFNFSSEVV